jgi:hypothetical protein
MPFIKSSLGIVANMVLPSSRFPPLGNLGSTTGSRPDDRNASGVHDVRLFATLSVPEYDVDNME